MRLIKRERETGRKNGERDSSFPAAPVFVPHKYLTFSLPLSVFATDELIFGSPLELPGECYIAVTLALWYVVSTWERVRSTPATCTNMRREEEK